MTLFTGCFIFGYILPSVISLVSFIFFSVKQGENEEAEDIVMGVITCMFPALNVAIAIISIAEWGAWLSSETPQNKK